MYTSRHSKGEIKHANPAQEIQRFHCLTIAMGLMKIYQQHSRRVQHCPLVSLHICSLHKKTDRWASHTAAGRQTGERKNKGRKGEKWKKLRGNEQEEKSKKKKKRKKKEKEEEKLWKASQ